MVVKNIEGIKAIMDSNDLNRLSEVMYMEWQKDYVKKIIRVKR